MTDILIFVVAAVLLGQAIIGLAFFISCIWVQNTMIFFIKSTRSTRNLIDRGGKREGSMDALEA
ncbi:hypothetical protein ACFL4N_05815 [Thermodesulfobacteriota bacterium]